MDGRTSPVERESGICPAGKCDTFQFMAKRLRVKVLHPGGLVATNILARRCAVSRDAMLLDVGCGRGSTTIHLAKRYGCRVVGVDLDQDLLLDAQRRALAQGASTNVAFRVADIHDLPFEDETFDGAVAQAVLIFTKKAPLLRHLYHKIRPGGFIAVDELAWKKEPPQQVRERVATTLCGAAVNAEEFDVWAELLRNAGFVVEYSESKDGGFSFTDMFRNEGPLSTFRIMAKSFGDAEVRAKMAEISRLFKETHEYLGYGLYVGRKSQST